MAKKMSLDTKKAKEFLVQKGERVGLGAAAVLTLLVLVLAFLGISTRPPAKAGAPTWGGAIEGAAAKLKQQMDTTAPPEKENIKGPELPQESEMKLAAITPPWFEP